VRQVGYLQGSSSALSTKLPEVVHSC